MIIELHHIDRLCRATTQHTFPVHWYCPPRGADILASRTIDGDEAQALFELFRKALRGPVDYSLCGHYPDYGLRVMEEGSVKFETTICLSCRNWIRLLNAQSERFDIDYEVFPELSATLQRLLPLSNPGD